jgi:hypothetical protein
MSEHGPDDPTLRMPAPIPAFAPKPAPAKPSRLPRRQLGAVLGVLVLLLGGGGLWLLLRPAPPAIQAVQAPRFTIQIASEATILANRAETLDFFRLDANPGVLVLDFPTLRQQGLMLNRVAALVEKIGLPHDRVLTDVELDAAIRAGGDTTETYYYGHDYAAADLARFFVLAARDGVGLTAEEQELRALLQQEGFLASGSRLALISLPREGSGAGMDAVLRRAILRHELSHAEFFSNGAYAAYVDRFWSEMDPAGRAAFTKFLAASDYDPAVPGLYANEMQAYLVHTPDTRIFNAGLLGISAEALARLQASFLIGMPAGWLRDRTVLPSGVSMSNEKRRRRLVRVPARRSRGAPPAVRAPDRAA